MDAPAQAREAPQPAGGVESAIEVDSAEDWLREQARIDAPHDHVQWLGGPSSRRGAFTMHRRYTAPAAGTVSCVDAPLKPWDRYEGSGKTTFISHDADRFGEEHPGEVLVMCQYGGPLATLGRIANALVSSKAFSKLLSADVLGWEFEHLLEGDRDVGAEVAFEASVQTLLRDAMQHGWLSADQHDWESFRDRIGGVRALCMELLGKHAGSEDWEARRELLEDLHGLAASATQLYAARGYELVIHIRAPDTANLVKDEVRLRDFLDVWRYTVPKHAVYESATGRHSHYRQAHEQRVEKRRRRHELGYDAAAPASTSTVRWVFSGRAATDLRPQIEQAIDEELAERVAAGEENAPYLDVDVVNANGYRSIKRVVKEYASLKGKQVAETSAEQQATYAADVDRLVRLCIAATGTSDRPHQGDPMAVAEAMLALASSTRSGDYLTVSDLEYAFSQLHPEEFLPELAPSASAIVQALLASDEPLTRSGVLEETGLSTSSWERALSGTATSAALSTLGIVTETTQNGQHARTATLAPWWSEMAPEGAEGDAGPGSLVSRRAPERDIVYELAVALDTGLDIQELFTWPVDLPAVYAQPDVGAWRAFIWAAVASGDEYETGPPDVSCPSPAGTVRLGIAPDEPPLSPEQTTFVSRSEPPTPAGDAIPKLTDGDGEGGQ